MQDTELLPAQSVMVGAKNPYTLLRGVLSSDDIHYLKRSCKQHLQKPDPISCFVLLNDRDSHVSQKIDAAVGQVLASKPHYLNDFYFFSDGGFSAGWHMDTELFTFEECWNAWILLSPDSISNPLAILDDSNTSAENYYHSLKSEGDHVIFRNYRNGRQMIRSVAEVEAAAIGTPNIEVGDILLFNPKMFHRTNTTVPKHAMVIKYAMKHEFGFVSRNQVPAMFWPEVKMFNRMLAGVDDWNLFLDSVRISLQEPEHRKALSAGFFPEKIPLYKEMSATL